MSKFSKVKGTIWGSFSAQFYTKQTLRNVLGLLEPHPEKPLLPKDAKKAEREEKRSKKAAQKRGRRGRGSRGRGGVKRVAPDPQKTRKKRKVSS